MKTTSRHGDDTSRAAIDALHRTLQESEERYRTLFDLVPVAVYTIDREGVIQTFNRHAAELWGRSPAVGDTDERFCGSYKLFHPDGTYMPHPDCPMAQVVTGILSYVHDAEVIIERLDGSRVTVVVNIRPHKNERGDVVGAINCFYDITQRKLNEDALRRSDRNKTEFLAMLAHDLRNPLAPILGSIEIVRRATIDDRADDGSRGSRFPEVHPSFRGETLMFSRPRGPACRTSFRLGGAADCGRLEDLSVKMPDVRRG